MKRNRVLVQKKSSKETIDMKTKKRPSYLTKVRARSDADTRGWFNASGPQVVALPPLSVAMGHFGCSGANFERWVPGKGPFSHFGSSFSIRQFLREADIRCQKHMEQGERNGKRRIPSRPACTKRPRTKLSTQLKLNTRRVPHRPRQGRSSAGAVAGIQEAVFKTRGRWECRESVARCEKPKPKLVASPRCSAILETEVL